MLISGLGSPGFPSRQRGGLGGLGLGSSQGQRAVFSFLKDGVGHSPVLTSSQLFSSFSSKFSGSFVFMHGDGSVQSGSLALTPSASAPTSVSSLIVPSGPSGTSVTGRRYVGATPTYDATAVQSPPAANFSVLIAVKPNASSTNADVIAQWAGSNTYWILRLSSAGQAQLLIGDNAGAPTTVVSTNTYVPRAWNFIVATYQRVGGAADNVASINLNGTTTSSSVMGLLRSNASTQAVYVGVRDGATNPLTGDVAYAAYMPGTLLSAGDLTDMSAAMRGTLAGSLGETVTHTRASVQTGVDANGLVSTVPNARALILNGGYLAEPAITQRALRSEEFDNAAWTATNVTVTANAHTAPDGTLTADTLAGTGAGGMVETTTAFAQSGTRSTISCWVRSTSGTQAGTIVLRDTTAGADLITISYTATTTWQRVSGTTAAATNGNNTTIRILPGGAGTGTTVCWGVNHEIAGAVPSSYVRAEGVNATRSGSVLTVPPTGWPTTAGEIRCRIMFPYGHPGVLGSVFAGTTGNSGISSSVNSNGSMTFSTDNGVAFTSTSGSALTWTAGQWYSLRFVWGGGVQSILRDSESVVAATGANMPDQYPAAFTIGATSAGATALGGYISDFEVFR